MHKMLPCIFPNKQPAIHKSRDNCQKKTMPLVDDTVDKVRLLDD